MMRNGSWMPLYMVPRSRKQERNYLPKHLTLCDCLKICHHYESLQYHLNVVRPMDKPVESISNHHFNKGGKQHQVGPKKSGALRNQPTERSSNSTNNTSPCSNCRMKHAKNHTCFKCNKIGHFTSVCRSSSSTQNTKQFTRFCGKAEHPEVEVSSQDNISMKQQRYQTPQPKLMRNLI